MSNFILGVLVAILTFHINHKVKRMYDIKLLINTLFDVFGNVESFSENDRHYVRDKLMDEILSLEKMHDDNFYVKIQILKLNLLKNLYNDKITLEEFNKGLGEINFKKLSRTFVILSILNLNPEFVIFNLKKQSH